ncbi:energy-coupling factor transporter ATPase [Bacillus vallismortis]|uniref:energy-coupling factor transporter ATPase n=1 Tax=Bacillus vallismortis TaxID=72361 RepID=UPI002280AC18|nr:energy-coupling factor transporter ATPase [Bacillus vallismortis]MCI4137567.1 energy-coupling factor transporter ATPase [Bacillus vallismortis]MCY7892835.1 energy-coupling factor transporter ATPase [Bacillus vallismortis]
MLTFNQVSFGYPGQEELIQKVSFQVEKGEFLSILGSNGSGKSTIAKLITGLLIPTKGEVTIGKYVTEKKQDLHSIRKKVGIIFQNAEDQFITSTVFDEVIFGLENIQYPPEEMKSCAEAALHKVGMLDFSEHEPHRLSGGQKQRTAIASILAMKPEIMIFDESTSMLDPQGRKQIMQVMKELHEEGLTIIHITHHMEEVLSAERVLILNEGNIVMEGTPKMVFNHSDKLQEYHLEVPFVIKAREGLIKRGFQIKDDVINIDELVESICRS